MFSGDARNDSPGYSAMYSTYTLMDHDTLEILQMSIIDKRHAGGKSPNMELMGLKKTLHSLLDARVQVVEVVTDQHPQIIKYLRKYVPSTLVHGYFLCRYFFCLRTCLF